MSRSIAALFQHLTQGVYVVGVAHGAVRKPHAVQRREGKPLGSSPWRALEVRAASVCSRRGPARSHDDEVGRARRPQPRSWASPSIWAFGGRKAFRRAVPFTENDAPDRSSPAPVPAIGRAHAAARRAFSRLAPAWPGCTGSGRHQNLLRMPAILLVRNHFSACAASAVSVTNRSNNRSGRLAPYFPIARSASPYVAVYVDQRPNAR